MKIIKFPVLFLLALLLFTFSLSSCGGEDPAPENNVVVEPNDPSDPNATDKDAFDAYIVSEMSSQSMPSLATLVFKGDEILYEKYYGKANLEQDLALNKDHLFLVASVSKTVTGAALLRLYDEGRFGLDDPINDYLSFPVNIPNQSTPITFRMLLTHTSSIADGDLLYDNYTFGGDTPLALKPFMESYLKVGGSRYNANDNFLDRAAGTQFEYSNAGSALIGVLVEEISGMSFTDYTRQNIFTPLGMNTSSWRLDEITGTIVQPYNVEDGNFVKIDHYTMPDYPNGGLRTTPREFSNFLNAIMNDGSYNGYQLLKPETAKSMYTPQTSLDPTMGFQMSLEEESLGLWGHNGGEEGTSTDVVFDPVTKISVIVFTNMSDIDLQSVYIKAFELGKKIQ
jgi:CubicO group peptidase (beta-lactamase class C family)